MTRYSPEFFATQSGRSLISARVVLRELFRTFHPRSVIDVGCGVAPWLRAAQELGVEELLGVDGDYVKRAHLLVDPSCFVAADLERQRVAEALGPGRRFDLVICMDVAEHLSFDRAPSLVEDLAGLGDVVLFSGAIPFQGGEHHINEQWPEFWALLFRKAGFACADLLRRKIWASGEVDWWYAQNTLVFFREDSAAAAALAPHRVADGESLSRVHPNNYLDQIHKWFHTHRYSAAAEENADLRALLDAYVAGATEPPELQAVARARAHPERTDVFPFTRSERFVPEEALEELRARIAGLEREIEIHREAAPALEAARREFERARTVFETEHADLRIEHEVLQSAHDRLRTAYRELQAAYEARPPVVPHDRARLRDLEERLVELQQLIRAQPHSPQDLQRSRAMRVAEFYYSLYSRPVIGPILGRLRRTAGGVLRAMRR